MFVALGAPVPDLKFVETRHARLAYRESAGPGLPLVMLHGNSSCGEIFRHQLNGPVGAAHRVIALDLPGHGASADARDPDRTYHFGGYASAVAEAMQALSVARYAVFGWSLGGHVALELTCETTAVVGVMISGTPPVGQHDGAVAEGVVGDIERSLAAQRLFSDAEAETFARATIGENAPFEPFMREAARRCEGRSRALMIAKAACGVGRNQQVLAESAPVPLAVVNGADDPFIRHAFIERLAYETLWDDRVHALPGLGHAPFWEAPDRFDPVLLRFLAGLGGNAGRTYHTKIDVLEAGHGDTLR